MSRASVQQEEGRPEAPRARPVVAAFDFDGTLTDRHTFWRFLRQVVGPVRFAVIVLRMLPVVLALALRRISLMQAREVLILSCLRGVPEQAVLSLGESFAANHLPGWLRPEGLARLRWHQAQGHRTIIVSNSAEYYLRPLARSAGIDDVLGSRFEARDGRLTGRLEGGHCQGAMKVRRLQELLGELGGFELHAYGDSSGDREMLAAADFAYLKTFSAPTGRRAGGRGGEPVGTRSREVLVVGAGPTGLTLACELWRAGVPCRVIDKAEAPPESSRAFVVHSRTLEVLEKMGLLDVALGHGERVSRLTIHEGRKRIISFDFGVLDAPHPYMLSLPQGRLEQLLAQRLEALGGRIERGVELVGLDSGEHSVTARLAHAGGREERVEVAWLAGCDGAHSAVRKLTGLQLEGTTYDSEYVIADGRLSGLEEGPGAHTFVSSTGYVMIFPLPGGNHRVVVDCPRGHHGSRPPVLDDVHERLKARGLPELKVGEPLWVTRTTFHRRIVPTYQAGRILLAGDAAHLHSPLGGQGMNTGIQDAYNLGWKLASVVLGQAPESLLESYGLERRAVALEVLAATDMQTRMLITRSPLKRLLRNWLAPAVTRLRKVQLRQAGQASGLSAHYRESRFVQQAPGAWRGGAHVRPGDRAPDAVLEGNEAAGPKRLFELLRSTRYVLLLFSGPTVDATTVPGLGEVAARVQAEFGHAVDVYPVLAMPRAPDITPATAHPPVLDATGELHRRYGAGAGSVFLIRPDGYIGFRGQPVEAEPLLGHLREVLLPAPAARRPSSSDTTAQAVSTP